MPLTPSQQNRVNYLSVQRALNRIDQTGKAAYARISGDKVLIHPDEKPHFKKLYVDTYTPRKKSHSKQAVYQRAYRLRKKAPPISHPLTPIITLVCEMTKNNMLSPEGYAIRQALDFLYARGHLRLNPEEPNIVYRDKPPAPIPYAPLRQHRMTSMEIAGISEVRAPKKAKKKDDGFTSHRLPSALQPEKEWPLENEQPKNPALENHAPEGTTLLQPYFEYAP